MRARPIARVLVSCGLVAGCGDSVAPIPSGDVEVRMLITDVGSERTEEAGIQCAVDVSLQAQGAEGAQARWGDVVVDVFDGSSGDSPLATVTFPASTVQDWIGELIVTGDERIYWFQATHGLPFRGTVRQSYQVLDTGASRTAEAWFECGSRASAGAPPRLSDMEIVGVAEPGRMLSVRFRATSDVGLWSAHLHVSGAYRSDQYVAISDGAQDREFEISHYIPFGSAVGGSVQQRIIMTDLTGGTTFVDLDAVTLVDVAPPEVRIHPHCKLSLGFCPTPTGRTFNIDVTTTDASSHAVAYWVGSPPLVSYSTQRPAGSAQELVMIPTSDLIVGRHPFAVTAQDASGLQSVDTLGGELLVYPSRKATVVSSELVGATTDVRIDGERDLLYLAQPANKEVTVVSLRTLAPTGAIPVSGEPWSLDLTASGDSLLVALGDQAVVEVVDPSGVRASTAVILEVLEPGFRARAIRVGVDGRWLVHADRKGVDAALVLVDPRSGDQTVLAQAGASDPWGRLLASDDGARIVTEVGCSRIWDVASQSLGSCGGWMESARLATDRRGSVFGDGWWTLDGDLTRIHADHPIGDGVQAVDFMPDGALQLLASPTGIHVLDIAPWLPILFLETGTLPSGRLNVSADGTFAIAWEVGEVRPSEGPTTLVRIPLDEVLALYPR